MKFPVNGGGGDFKRASPGMHLAVCNLVADVGLQPGSRQFPNPKRKVYIRFEIPGERVSYEKDGREIEGPITIGSFYTASMNEKAQLRKHLEGWRGRAFTDEQAADFDVSSILGKPCMLSLVESSEGGKTYTNIASIGSLPKGIEPPKPENTLLYYDEERPQQFDALPKWLREKIEQQLQPEPPKQPAEKVNHGGPGFDDTEIPF